MVTIEVDFLSVPGKRERDNDRQTVKEGELESVRESSARVR